MSERKNEAEANRKANQSKVRLYNCSTGSVTLQCDAHCFTHTVHHIHIHIHTFINACVRAMRVSCSFLFVRRCRCVVVACFLLRRRRRYSCARKYGRRTGVVDWHCAAHGALHTHCTGEVLGMLLAACLFDLLTAPSLLCSTRSFLVS